MSEYAVGACFIAICTGQILAWRRGLHAAVTYCLCAAPLEYFSLWNLATLDVWRTCASLLIGGCLLSRRHRDELLAIARHPYRYLVAYGVVVTVVGMLVWPTHTISHSSPIYAELRGGIQIVNWLLVTLSAWLIGQSFRDERRLQVTLRWMVAVGTLLAIYAGYQYAADILGLPHNGIRRPWAGVVASEGDGEEMAAYFVDSTRFYRPNSLMCEPKDFGAHCILWITILLAGLATGPLSRQSVGQMAIIAGGLFLSMATSAWISFVAVLGVGLWVATTKPQLGVQFARRIAPFVLFALVVLGFALGSHWDTIGQYLDVVVTERWSNRLGGPISDLPELLAIQVLSEQPSLGIFGVGLGGISFYIAELIGGTTIVLFPNTGLLGFVCNIGVVGLGLMAITFKTPLLRLFLPIDERLNRNALALAFIGSGALLQCFVFPKGELQAVAFGAFLAAGYRFRHDAPAGAAMTRPMHVPTRVMKRRVLVRQRVLRANHANRTLP